jgi:hypothetical protein
VRATSVNPVDYKIRDGRAARFLVDERPFMFESVGDAHHTAEHGSSTGKVVVTNPWTWSNTVSAV